jgi:hypothetical protein
MVRIHIEVDDLASAEEVAQVIANECERLTAKYPGTANMLAGVANQIIDQIADTALAPSEVR